MIVELTILTIWLLGWMLSIYPIYNAWMRHRVNEIEVEYNRNRKLYPNLYRNRDRDREEFTAHDVTLRIMWSSITAMVWFLLAPFLISFWLWRRQKPNVNQEISRTVQDFEDKKKLEKILAEARKDLEQDALDKWELEVKNGR